MPDINEMIEHMRRLAHQTGAATKDWYSVQAKAGSRSAEVRIYDEIGWFGTSARSFAEDLAGLDVDEISLRLNSPGGNAWDGIAIYNSLRAHKAKVKVTVDGLAASAASVIAMAGDELVMNLGSQLMIHDAWVVAIGNAEDLVHAASIIEKLSASMADIYASRAGGSSADWRAAMTAETWYTAEEAVDAGLADALAADTVAEEAKARFDLTAFAFAYAGRAAAPTPAITPRPPAAPKPPAAPAPGTARQEGAGQMDPAKIREALGLPADSPDSEVSAAMLAANAKLTTPATPPATPPAGPPATEPATPKPPAASTAHGTMTIDVTAWDEQQKRIQRLEAGAAKAARDERDQVIAQAVADGKFAPARKEHWARLWDADPEGTRTVIDTLAKGVVPMSEMGYGLDATGEDIDAEFAHLFPAPRKGN
jgi:ATP-dependent protease ClpP protease subunit